MILFRPFAKFCKKTEISRLPYVMTITFNGKPYRSENGLPDWIAYNIPQTPLYEPIHLEGEDIELVLTHYDGSGTILGSFVNGQFTIDGGTHLPAFKEAVARALMDF